MFTLVLNVNVLLKNFLICRPKILIVHFKSSIFLNAYLLAEKNSHRALLIKKAAHQWLLLALGG